MVTEGTTLTVTLVALAAFNVPLLAETVSHAEVLASDQLKAAPPVLVSTRLTPVAMGGRPCCVTAVNPAVGVICKASPGLGSATCMITTEGEQSQSKRFDQGGHTLKSRL